MKAEVLKKVKQAKSSFEKLNTLRDELQHVILQEVDRKSGFDQISFLGGTALRIIYQIDRFSEDLDFSTANHFANAFDLKSLVTPVKKSISAFGFDCEITKLKNQKAVQSCFFAFPNILHQADKSFLKNQKLLIKFEVDTNPPRDATELVSPIAAQHLYKVRHYDLPSLFAGKLHAILHRPYTKGRDLYDFLWYMGKKVPANLKLLNNAVKQTQKDSKKLTEKSLKALLRQRFEKTDFKVATDDVAPFVFDQRSLELFEKSIFLNATESISCT